MEKNSDIWDYINLFIIMLILIYLFITNIHRSCHSGVDTHQRLGKRAEGKTSERSEEKERDRGTEGETPNPIPGNWCAHRGGIAERKKEENEKKETGKGSPTHLPCTFSRLLRQAGIIRWAQGCQVSFLKIGRKYYEIRSKSVIHYICI